MASYSIQADNTSQATPKLIRGKVLIISQTSVYFKVGNDPVADPKTCALLPAGSTRELRLPTGCLQIAVLAVKDPGNVSIVEVNETKASCSA